MRFRKCCADAHALLPTGEVGVATRTGRMAGSVLHPPAQAPFLGAEGGDTRSGGSALPLRGAGAESLAFLLSCERDRYRMAETLCGSVSGSRE